VSSLEEALAGQQFNLQDRQTVTRQVQFNHMATLDQHTAAVFSLFVSLGENRLYTGSRDMTIKVWDLETWLCLGTWEGHTATVTCLAFSAKLFRLFSGCGNGTIKVWDTLTNTSTPSNSPGRCLQTWTSHEDIVTCLVLHEETDRLYSSSFDKTIKCWNILDGTCVGRMCGHTDHVRSIVLGKSNSPSAGCLYSASDDKTIKAWNLQTYDCIHTFTGINSYVYSVTLSGNGTRLYGGTHNGTIRVWDTTSPSYGCMKVIQGHSQFVMTLVVSSGQEGQKLYSGAGDGMIKVWDMCDNNHTCLTTIQAHTDNIRCIALSNEEESFEKQLFSGSMDKLVQVYGLEE
jgi:WD40 repeat protein